MVFPNKIYFLKTKERKKERWKEGRGKEKEQEKRSDLNYGQTSF